MGWYYVFVAGDRFSAFSTLWYVVVGNNTIEEIQAVLWVVWAHTVLSVCPLLRLQDIATARWVGACHYTSLSLNSTTLVCALVTGKNGDGLKWSKSKRQNGDWMQGQNGNWSKLWKSRWWHGGVSHTCTVMQEWSEGDDEKWWGRAKFDPPPPLDPLTNRHHNLRRWLRPGYLPPSSLI